jgi:hypothetical protein
MASGISAKWHNIRFQQATTKRWPMKQKLLNRANQKFATNQNKETTFINQTCRLLRSLNVKVALPGILFLPY